MGAAALSLEGHSGAGRGARCPAASQLFAPSSLCSPMTTVLRSSGNDFIIALLTPLSSVLGAIIFVAAGATALTAYGEPATG